MDVALSKSFILSNYMTLGVARKVDWEEVIIPVWYFLEVSFLFFGCLGSISYLSPYLFKVLVF